MKKVIQILSLTLILGFAIVGSSTLRNEPSSNTTITNISLLSASAETEGPNTQLYGPRETEDCKWIGTGNKEVCKCENNITCTDSACY